MKERTILIVEDDKPLLDVLEYHLNKEGYNVVTALDGSQTIEVALGSQLLFDILSNLIPKPFVKTRD